MMFSTTIYHFCLNGEGAIVSHGFIKTKKYHIIIIFVYRLLYDPVSKFSIFYFSIIEFQKLVCRPIHKAKMKNKCKMLR